MRNGHSNCNVDLSGIQHNMYCQQWCCVILLPLNEAFLDLLTQTPVSGPGLAPAQRSFISHDSTETTTRNWTEFSYLPALVCPVLARIATPLYPLLSPHKLLMSSPTSCEYLTSSIHKFMIYIFKCLSSNLAIRRFIHLLEFATIPFTFR